MPLAAASAATNQHYQTQLGMWCKEALGGHPKMKEYVVKDWRALEHTLKMLKIGQTVDIPLAVPLEGEAGKPYFHGTTLASALSICYGGFVGAPCSEPNAEAKTVGAWDVLQRCGRRKWIDKTDKEASGRNGEIRARLPSFSLPLRISRLWGTSTVWSGS